jgi:hypothetical protein
MVGSLVTLLFLALLQLAVGCYLRNVLAACAIDGARYGANADILSPAAGAGRANQEISRTLGPSYATAYAPVRQPTVGGAAMVTVEVQARLPLLAWFLPVGPSLHVTGRALAEPK